MNNITAGAREREDENRTSVPGGLDEIHGVVANTLNGASGKRCEMDKARRVSDGNRESNISNY